MSEQCPGYETLSPITYPQRILGDMFSLRPKDLVPLSSEIASSLEADTIQGLQRLQHIHPRDSAVLHLRFSELQEGAGRLVTYREVAQNEVPPVDGSRIKQILTRAYRIIRGTGPSDYADFCQYAFLSLAETSQKKFDPRLVFGEDMSGLARVLGVPQESIVTYLRENNFYTGRTIDIRAGEGTREIATELLNSVTLSSEVMQYAKARIEEDLLSRKSQQYDQS